jgi:pantetheine-phosphate adenylyltransferase
VRIAVYPGSFDPVHHGHIDVIRRASHLFDRIIVAVAENVEKGRGAFALTERVAMLTEVLADLPSVEVAAYDGLTVVFARERGATCVVKGLRAVGDFDFELKQSAMNRKLAPDLDTLLLIADPEYAFISSSLIREVASLGGAVDSVVPATVARRLRVRWPAGTGR